MTTLIWAAQKGFRSIGRYSTLYQASQVLYERGYRNPFYQTWWNRMKKFLKDKSPELDYAVTMRIRRDLSKMDTDTVRYLFYLLLAIELWGTFLFLQSGAANVDFIALQALTPKLRRYGLTHPKLEIFGRFEVFEFTFEPKLLPKPIPNIVDSLEKIVNTRILKITRRR